MTSWMRAQPLPRFFLACLIAALAAVLMGTVATVLAFHDHLTTSDVVRAIVTVPVVAAAVTLGEWLRR